MLGKGIKVGPGFGDGGSNQKGIGTRKVAVNGLTGNSKLTRDVADSYLIIALVNRALCCGEDAVYGFGV